MVRVAEPPAFAVQVRPNVHGPALPAACSATDADVVDDAILLATGSNLLAERPSTLSAFKFVTLFAFDTENGAAEPFDVTSFNAEPEPVFCSVVVAFAWLVWPKMKVPPVA